MIIVIRISFWKNNHRKKIYEKLKHSDEKWIFLDGDTFRNILGEDLGHTIEDRRKNAIE